MMQHASTHRRLLVRQTTFIQRIYASANDCLMPVTVKTAADAEDIFHKISLP